EPGCAHGVPHQLVVDHDICAHVYIPVISCAFYDDESPCATNAGARAAPRKSRASRMRRRGAGTFIVR
ncbi:MAG TPA: hypothetical protein VIG55_00780, partial [Methylosinus sp.]